MKLIYMLGATVVVALWSLVVMVGYWVVAGFEGALEGIGGTLGLGWLADLAGDATQVLIILVWLGVCVAIYVAAWLIAAGKSALLSRIFGRAARSTDPRKPAPRLPERFR